MRRAVLARLRNASGGADAEDDARSIAVHGLADDAALALAARGEPGALLGAWRAARAVPTVRGVYAVLGVTSGQLRAGRVPVRGRAAVAALAVPCAPDCDHRARATLRALAGEQGEEPAPPQMPAGAADTLLDLLADGEEADHLREEFHLAAAWVRAQGDRSRALLDAVAHTQARAERGTVHDVLRHGAASPGATALAARILGAETDIDVAVFGWERGVALRTTPATRLITLCASPRQVARVPREAVRLAPTDVALAAALEGAGSALRAGDLDRAQALHAHAGTGPAPAPYLARALATWEAIVVAAAGPVATAEATGTRFAPLLRLQPRRRPPVPAGARPTDVTATARRVADLAPDSTGLALAAWWAAAYGHADLARALLPARPAGPAGIVARAAARLIGEPVGEEDLSALAEAETFACASALLPWPLPR